MSAATLKLQRSAHLRDLSVYVEGTEALADVTLYFTDTEAFASCDIDWSSLADD